MKNEPPIVLENDIDENNLAQIENKNIHDISSTGDSISQGNRRVLDSRIIEDSSWGDTIDAESRNQYLKTLNEREKRDDSWDEKKIRR